MSFLNFISGYLNAVSENMQVTPIILLQFINKNRPAKQTLPSTSVNLIFWTYLSGTFHFFWEKSHIFQYGFSSTHLNHRKHDKFLTEGKEFSIETLEIADLRYSKLPRAKFFKLNLMFSTFRYVSKARTYLSRGQESSKPNKSEDTASY